MILGRELRTFPAARQEAWCEIRQDIFTEVGRCRFCHCSSSGARGAHSKPCTVADQHALGVGIIDSSAQEGPFSRVVKIPSPLPTSDLVHI